MTLFNDPNSESPTEFRGTVMPDDIPWTLDRAIAVFLNRWSWRAAMDTVECELRELIAEAQAHKSQQPTLVEEPAKQESQAGGNG